MTDPSKTPSAFLLAQPPGGTQRDPLESWEQRVKALSDGINGHPSDAAARVAQIEMSTSTEFFRWYITDERTGKHRRTTYAMTRAEAAERFPGAEPDLRTREVRNLPAPGEGHGNTRPPS